MTDSSSTYRVKVINKHKAEFDLHTRVATLVERAALSSRTRPSIVHLVLDMLMLQSYKSHAAVSLLCQHGMMEDAATIVRRLLEISVQMVFIGADDDERDRTRKAGRYLAFMWRTIPRKAKLRLPDELREEWSATARSYGRFVPKRAKSWGPSFFDMFKAIGSEKLYRSDYAFLSAMAHGTPDSQVFQFSASRIRVHRDDVAPILLIYSSRYHLQGAAVWNEFFTAIDGTQFDVAAKEVGSWRRKKARP